MTGRVPAELGGSWSTLGKELRGTRFSISDRMTKATDYVFGDSREPHAERSKWLDEPRIPGEHERVITSVAGFKALLEQEGVPLPLVAPQRGSGAQQRAPSGAAAQWRSSAPASGAAAAAVRTAAAAAPPPLTLAMLDDYVAAHKHCKSCGAQLKVFSRAAATRFIMCEN
jgi:hypothetical protein